MTALLFLAGCLGNNTETIEVTTKPIEKPELTLPEADELRIREIEWVIITPNNYEEVFSKLQEQGRPVALFALTDKGYENLGLNLSDLRAYIQQQQTIIAAYENYYKKVDETLNNAVTVD